MTDAFKLKQREIFDLLEEKFRHGDHPASIIESVKDYESDRRLCLTSVVYIPEEISNQLMRTVIEPLREADPRQYFYGPPSLHTTILTIREFTGVDPFNDEELGIATQVFQEVIRNHSRINYSFQELFELPTSLGVRGYSSENLVALVSELREKLKKAGLPDDRRLISDKIYFGHITICRYTTPPNQKFLKLIRELKNIHLSDFTAQNVHLIQSRMAFSKDNTKLITSFNLN